MMSVDDRIEELMRGGLHDEQEIRDRLIAEGYDENDLPPKGWMMV